MSGCLRGNPASWRKLKYIRALPAYIKKGEKPLDKCPCPVPGGWPGCCPASRVQQKQKLSAAGCQRTRGRAPIVQAERATPIRKPWEASPSSSSSMSTEPDRLDKDRPTKLRRRLPL